MGMPELKVKRRSVLKSLAFAPLAMEFANSNDAWATEPPRAGTGILQGFTDSKNTVLTILGQSGWTFQVDGAVLERVTHKTLHIDSYVLYRLQIGEMSTTAESLLRIFDGQNKPVDARRFKGLDLSMSDPRIAVMSCSSLRTMGPQERMWQQTQRAAPDLIFFLGDLVYSNSVLSTALKKPEKPLSALRRYIDTWLTVDLYRLDPLIPVFATWDDHDYGFNNGDSTHPYKKEMSEIFRSFYPLPSSHYRLSQGPGMSYRVNAFGIDFYLMDGRSFFRPEISQWGAEQQAWLEHDYLTSPSPAWLMNGTQFFNYIPLSESIEKNSPPTFQFVKSLIRRKQKPALLFSGDVHYSQIQKLESKIFGFETFEISSSCMHSILSGDRGKRTPEQGQIFFCKDPNFLIFQPTLQGGLMRLSGQCITETKSTGLFNLDVGLNRPFDLGL
jgi:alkaline phosphatase D